MTRRRKLVFALAAMSLSLVVTIGAVLAADLYVHHRAEESAGLNRWGYRGPVVGGKKPGELRIVMVGGSTVFGYGGPWHEAAPAFLEQELRNARSQQPVTVINLGYNNEGAFAALPTLEDYRYLDYDLVVLYQGYNDRGGDGAPNNQVYRRQSVIFRMTGYSPILPLALQEKALALRTGSVANSHVEGKPVFRPNLAQRTSASALEAADAIGQMLGRQLDRLASQPAGIAVPGKDCLTPWSQYCESVIKATSYARALGAKVLIVNQPIYPYPPEDKTEEEVERSQHASLTAAIHKNFATDAGVAMIDLSDDIDLSDRDLSFDRMHLGRDGNLKLARLMAPAVAKLAWPTKP